MFLSFLDVIFNTVIEKEVYWVVERRDRKKGGLELPSVSEGKT